jgi:hypothetical protein
MSDDELPDLEPIDLAEESRRATTAPAAPNDALAAGTPTTGLWSPGWYADPWTAGQYRYWSGQAWTGETNRWGPANAGSARTPGATDPWPSMSTPISSGYSPPFAAANAGAAPAAPPLRGRGPLIAGISALVVAVLLSGAIGFAIESNSHSSSTSQSPSATPFNPAPFIPTPTTPNLGTTSPTTIPPSAISHDPDRHVLSDIVVHQADVAPSRKVLLIPSGNQLNEPTLDLCNGAFPSERLRTARLQVAEVDSSVNPSLSTEAVLYRNTPASEQAFAELRKVSASCPHHEVASPVGDPTAETVFGAPPDGSWPRTPAAVERQAYSFTTIAAATATAPASRTASVAVYLRRGRALLGLYFAAPNGTQSAVAGRRTIEGIVGVFEARMAKLPAAVVNAG